MNESELNHLEGQEDEDPSPFVARKSKRFIQNEAVSDGDVWNEYIIVVQTEPQGRRKGKIQYPLHCIIIILPVVLFAIV
jgi:hypothetical protein